MKLKKFSKGLIALGLGMFIIGGLIIGSTANTKSLSIIGGGGHEVEDCTTSFPF